MLVIYSNISNKGNVQQLGQNSLNKMKIPRK